MELVRLSEEDRDLLRALQPPIIKTKIGRNLIFNKYAYNKNTNEYYTEYSKLNYLIMYYYHQIRSLIKRRIK